MVFNLVNCFIGSSPAIVSGTQTPNNDVVDAISLLHKFSVQFDQEVSLQNETIASIETLRP